MILDIQYKDGERTQKTVREVTRTKNHVLVFYRPDDGFQYTPSLTLIASYRVLADNGTVIEEWKRPEALVLLEDDYSRVNTNVFVALKYAATVGTDPNNMQTPDIDRGALAAALAGVAGLNMVILCLNVNGEPTAYTYGHLLEAMYSDGSCIISPLDGDDEVTIYINVRKP